MNFYNHYILQHIQDLNSNICSKNKKQKSTLNPPEESFIQAIWNEQALNRSFITTDGSEVTILYAGTWNDEPGPDFLHAKIRLDNKIISGDIEIHKVANLWYSHHHQNNENYNNVILHIVWQDSACKPNIPTIIIKDQIPTEIINEELLKDFNHYSDCKKFYPSLLALYLIPKSDQQIKNFFNTAAVIRFNEKTSDLKKNIAHIGRERTLVYGIADALGYKNNRQQFAKLVNYLNLNGNYNDRLAQIWGIAGLIPDPTKENVNNEILTEVRKLWHNWWLQRSDDLPLIKWSKLGRPLNSPFRRVAAFALLLANPDTIKQLVDSLEQNLNYELINQWRKTLTLPENTYENFANFNKKLPKPSALLGNSRLDCIIINLMLPLYAAVNPKFNNLSCEIFISFRLLDSNHIIKEAINRFFIPPARAKKIMTTNGCQQGMIKMIRLLESKPREAFNNLIKELMQPQKNSLKNDIY
ncbi:MAG: DUF2851 family protein [Lentisphaeria bacterium]